MRRLASRDRGDALELRAFGRSFAGCADADDAAVRAGGADLEHLACLRGRDDADAFAFARRAAEPETLRVLVQNSVALILRRSRFGLAGSDHHEHEWKARNGMPRHRKAPEMGEKSSSRGRNSNTTKAIGLNISPRITQAATERFFRYAIRPFATVMRRMAVMIQCQNEIPLMVLSTDGRPGATSEPEQPRSSPSHVSRSRQRPKWVRSTCRRAKQRASPLWINRQSEAGWIGGIERGFVAFAPTYVASICVPFPRRIACTRDSAPYWRWLGGGGRGAWIRRRPCIRSQ